MSELPRNTPGARIIPVTRWADYHDWPTLAGFRWLLLKRETNGLEAAGVVKWGGRRLLIDEAAFFRWLDQAGALASTPVA